MLWLQVSVRHWNLRCDTSDSACVQCRLDFVSFHGWICYLEKNIIWGCCSIFWPDDGLNLLFCQEEFFCWWILTKSCTRIVMVEFAILSGRVFFLILAVFSVFFWHFVTLCFVSPYVFYFVTLCFVSPYVFIRMSFFPVLKTDKIPLFWLGNYLDFGFHQQINFLYFALILNFFCLRVLVSSCN
jgi:hypothetical protein